MMSLAVMLLLYGGLAMGRLGWQSFFVGAIAGFRGEWRNYEATGHWDKFSVYSALKSGILGLSLMFWGGIVVLFSIFV